MVDRVLHERPRHRVVGSERHEAAPCRRGCPEQAGSGLSREHHFVQEGVRVPPIDESLAPRAGIELTLLERPRLEVEHHVPGEMLAGVVQYHHRLRQVELALRFACEARPRLREETYRVEADATGVSGGCWGE